MRCLLTLSHAGEYHTESLSWSWAILSAMSRSGPYLHILCCVGFRLWTEGSRYFNLHISGDWCHSNDSVWHIKDKVCQVNIFSPNSFLKGHMGTYVWIIPSQVSFQNNIIIQRCFIFLTKFLIILPNSEITKHLLYGKL